MQKAVDKSIGYIYKRGRGFEIGTAENKSSRLIEVSRARLEQGTTGLGFQRVVGHAAFLVLSIDTLTINIL